MLFLGVAVPSPPFRSAVARIAVYAHGASRLRKKHAGVTSVLVVETVVVLLPSSSSSLLLVVPRGRASDTRVDVGICLSVCVCVCARVDECRDETVKIKTNFCDVFFPIFFTSKRLMRALFVVI